MFIEYLQSIVYYMYKYFLGGMTVMGGEKRSSQ